LNNSRYEKAGVFNQKTVKTQAQALQKAGYATSPDYADLVNKVYSSVSKEISQIKQTNKSFPGLRYLIPLVILALFVIFEE